MITSFDKAISDHEIKERLIGYLTGNKPGPTVIFFGGIHGNEPAGVLALEAVFKELKSNKDISFNGTAIAIRGNIFALKEQKRFIDSDLNRMWTEDQVTNTANKELKELTVEERELLDIQRVLRLALTTGDPPFYFIDYHTTSSRTLPFITINDALINRKFAQLFSVPVILGIEEFLEGPLMSYINEKGLVGLGFESGRHQDRDSVDNSIAFTWLVMKYAGFLNPESLPQEAKLKEQLRRASDYNKNYYEVTLRHDIVPSDKFKILSDYQSFDPVVGGSDVAEKNGDLITVDEDSIIFMPLYQRQGREGFFLIRKIPLWALNFSAFLRRVKAYRILPLLPGVRWSDTQDGTLIVNPGIARFFTRQIFHLLGYRRKETPDHLFEMTNREKTAKTEMYKNTWWYKKKRH